MVGDGYRKLLPEEPHVGHPVVDLAQHVLQIFTGYPKRIKRYEEKFTPTESVLVSSEVKMKTFLVKSSFCLHFYFLIGNSGQR